MRAFKTKLFSKWAYKESISDPSLCLAIKEIEVGLVDACLGGSIYKKRVATTGKGKRGGARTLLAYRSNELAFFVFGFKKSERGNISHNELTALKN